MSKCRVCAKAPACDWETPPEICLDFTHSALPPIDLHIESYLGRYCELVMRGGSRHLGWVRGLEDDFLVFECENRTVLSVDLDSGAELVCREGIVGGD